MRVVLKRWGSNAAVQLPAAIVEAACFRLGQPLEVREEHGRIIIEPAQVRLSEIDIEAVCATLDPNERPELEDFASAGGSEVW